MTAGLLEAAEIVTVEFPPAPALMPARVTVWRPELSFTVRLVIALSVGGAMGDGTTVTIKAWLIRLLLVAPLFTVTVTVAVPSAFAAGAKVKVPTVLELV